MPQRIEKHVVLFALLSPNSSYNESPHSINRSPKLTSPPEDPSKVYEPKDPAQIYKAAQRDHPNGSIGILKRIKCSAESMASCRRFKPSQYNNRNNQTKVVDSSYPYLAYIIELCASAVSAASVPSFSRKTPPPPPHRNPAIGRRLRGPPGVRGCSGAAPRSGLPTRYLASKLKIKSCNIK